MEIGRDTKYFVSAASWLRQLGLVCRSFAAPERLTGTGLQNQYYRETTMKHDHWSEMLIAQTREMLGSFPITRDGHVALKNIDGTFGTIAVVDLMSGDYAVQERGRDQRHQYASVEELILAGWAID
jgi:hypothetical protein